MLNEIKASHVSLEHCTVDPRGNSRGSSALLYSEFSCGFKYRVLNFDLVLAGLGFELRARALPLKLHFWPFLL
jgi:hypothetical protein